MFAAVPTAHQPCGANGCQLSPPRDGSAIAIADAITTTSTDASTSWKPDDTRSPNAFAASTVAEHAEADRRRDRRPRAGEVGDVVAADQRDRRAAAEHGRDEEAAGDRGRRVTEPLADVRGDPARDRMAHAERRERDGERRRQDEQRGPREDRRRPGRVHRERGHEQHAGTDQRADVQRSPALDIETMGVGFRHGFRAMMPLWLGVAPFAFAYAVLARDAGLSLVETQALSLLVFAGSAQVSAVGLFGRGAGGLEVVLTTFLLNVRHVLYGMSLGRVVPMTRRERLIGAYLLTDEAYGVSVARGARTFPFVLGTEVSLFVVWNVTTFVGCAGRRSHSRSRTSRRRLRVPGRVHRDPRAAATAAGRRRRGGRRRRDGLAAREVAAGRRARPRRGRLRRAPRGVAHAMSFWPTCLGMLAVTFGSRLAGLLVRMRLPPFWLRFLHFVPIAVFAALVTPSLEGSRGEGGIRVAAGGARRCRRVADTPPRAHDRRRPGGVLAVAPGLDANSVFDRPSTCPDASSATARASLSPGVVRSAVSNPLRATALPARSAPARGPESSRHDATSVAPFHDT